jgi:FkbM family methyltransferase
VRCRIADSGSLLSVHVDRDYDVPGFDWKRARSIVDVGANVGSFTVWAANRAPGARFVAVEPNPRTYGFLRQNVLENGLQDRVKVLNVAVGTEPGWAGLELVDHPLGTRLARNGVGDLAVEVRTIERLLLDAGMRQVDMLKIDCEGMEYDLFKSMEERALRSVRAVACEYHDEPGHDVRELEAALSSSGFAISRSDGSTGIIWGLR